VVVQFLGVHGINETVKKVTSRTGSMKVKRRGVRKDEHSAKLVMETCFIMLLSSKPRIDTVIKSQDFN